MILIWKMCVKILDIKFKDLNQILNQHALNLALIKKKIMISCNLFCNYRKNRGVQVGT